MTHLESRNESVNGRKSQERTSRKSPAFIARASRPRSRERFLSRVERTAVVGVMSILGFKARTVGAQDLSLIHI